MLFKTCLVAFYVLLFVGMVVSPRFRRYVFGGVVLNFSIMVGILRFLAGLPRRRYYREPMPTLIPRPGPMVGAARRPCLPPERLPAQLAVYTPVARAQIPSEASVALQPVVDPAAIARAAAVRELVVDHSPRSPRELLQETLQELDSEPSWGLRDEAVFLLGFPDLKLEEFFEGRPKLQKHLPVDRCGTKAEALLRCSRERNREDIVGRVAELLIKMHSH